MENETAPSNTKERLRIFNLEPAISRILTGLSDLFHYQNVMDNEIDMLATQKASRKELDCLRDSIAALILRVDVIEKTATQYRAHP